LWQGCDMARPKKRIDWQDVVRALEESKALPVFLARLQALQNKGSGRGAQPVPASSLDRSGLVWDKGTPIQAVADFAWSKAARDAVADAMTYAEDWLEYEFPRDKQRARIAKVRRALEDELESLPI